MIFTFELRVLETAPLHDNERTERLNNFLAERKVESLLPRNVVVYINSRQSNSQRQDEYDEEEAEEEEDDAEEEFFEALDGR